MIALVALLIGVAQPPAAYLDPGHVRLAVSSWCWGAHCGAPISASTKNVIVTRSSTVRVDLSFVPTRVRVAIAGRPTQATREGREVTWPAHTAGGVTLSVTGAKGWITYVGRLVVRP